MGKQEDKVAAFLNSLPVTAKVIVTLIFVASIVGVAVGVVVLVKRGCDSYAIHAGRGSDLKAQRACEGFVRGQITYKETAEFPGIFSYEKTSPGCVFNEQSQHWLCGGEVVAKNAFGVPVRYSYVCETSLEDGGWINHGAYLYDQ